MHCKWAVPILSECRLAWEQNPFVPRFCVSFSLNLLVSFFPLITWILIYLVFFFLFDMHNTSICVWRCLWYKVKQNVPTWHDLLHQEESNLSSSLTIIITFFFFFAFRALHFVHIQAYIFKFFFSRNRNWKLYYLNLHILKYLSFVFTQESLPGVLVLFPSKHLETDHLLPFVI